MRFSVVPMTCEYARQVHSWAYDGPYAFYNAGETDEVDDLNEMMDGSFHAVLDATNELVGFLTFGESAQVPGAARVHLYTTPALDIGLGMRPDLTGRGHGAAFVRAGLDFARELYRPAAFRLVVATFNRRAIRVYERTGFIIGMTFTSPTPNGDAEFVLMTREA